jgi:hypothetical protein
MVSMSRIRVTEIGYEGGWSTIVYRENGGSWMRMTSTKYKKNGLRTLHLKYAIENEELE